MNYNFYDNRIEPCYLMNDIGVDIDSLLHFHKHTDHIVAKAYSRIGILFRGYVSRNLHVLRQAYMTYITPLLKYAKNVWYLHLIVHSNSLEIVRKENY